MNKLKVEYIDHESETDYECHPDNDIDNNNDIDIEKEDL